MRDTLYGASFIKHKPTCFLSKKRNPLHKKCGNLPINFLNSLTNDNEYAIICFGNKYFIYFN